MSNKKIVIETANIESFFRRGRELAKLMDTGKPIPDMTVISFGSPAEMLEAITPARIELVRVVREQPDSISGLARRVNRDRSAVARDIKALVSLGLVQADEEVNPGHGRHKLVKAIGAGELKLEAVI
jgi:predicted transcriptional regulator